MPSTLELSDNDTRESALWKVGEWFDGIADEHAVTFVAAISRADMQPYMNCGDGSNTRGSARPKSVRGSWSMWGKCLAATWMLSRTP